MGFPIYRLVSLGIFLISWTDFGSSLRVVQTPQPFTSSTEELNISCIADDPSYMDKSILGIQIMIEDKFIALINMGGELKTAVGIKDNVKAKGHIDPESKKGYLTLIIDKPRRQDGGTYKCQIFVVNKNFQIVEKSAIGDITYQACPVGWKHYQKDQTCLKVYGKGRDMGLSWSDAREKCKTFDGDLVQIRDEDKSKFVYNLIEGSNYAWIGVRNHARRGFDFKYVDGTDIGSYHPWGGTDPSGDADSDEKCVFMYTHPSNYGLWYDKNCSYRYSYVCSMPCINVL